VAAPGARARVGGFRNLFLAPLTTDTIASTVYGTALSLGAQSKLTFKLQPTTHDLMSANALEDFYTLWTHGEWTIEYGEINLDADDLIMGGKRYTDAAGGKDIWAYVAGMSGGTFGIFGQPDIANAAANDYYMALACCKATTSPNFDLGAGFTMQGVSGRAIKTRKDGLIFHRAILSSLTTITAAVALADAQSAITSGT
jgi:hypothetical protein